SAISWARASASTRSSARWSAWSITICRCANPASASSTPIAVSAWSRSRTSPIGNSFMPLIRVESGRAAAAEDSFATVADDAALPPSGGAIVSLARFQRDRDQLLARNAPIGVRLKSAESPELLGEDLSRLAVEFPAFRDGRGFSWARMLRTRLGFRGEVRATGNYLYDQIAYLVRVGFDSFEPPAGLDAAAFNRALQEMTNVYQPSSDGKKTIRELRAGK